MLAAFTLIATLSKPQFDPKELDSAVKEHLKSGTPNVAVAVSRNGKLVYNKVFGKDGQLPTSTRFRIGSITKQFTSVLIIQLVRDGKLRYEDTLGNLMPETPIEWHSVTVRQLLTHTSGIPSYTDQPTFWTQMHKNQTSDGVWKIVRKQKMDFQPGKGWNYNNTGYALLGSIVERKTGKPYFEVLKERIIKPLGLSNTGEESDAPTLPGVQLGGKPALKLSMDWPYAAGAIVSTSEDLVKWSEALKGTKVLTASEKELAWTPDPVALKFKEPYGFGWVPGYEKGKRVVIEHGGSINGFNSMLRYLFEPDVSIAVLSNREDNVASTVADRVKLMFVELPSPVANADVNRTTKDRELFEKVLAGKAVEADFTPDFIKAVPLKQMNAISKSVSAMGAISKFYVIKDGPVREYLCILGSNPVKLTFGLDDQNRIKVMLLGAL